MLGVTRLEEVNSVARREDMSRRIAVTLRRLLQLDIPAARERRLSVREFVIARAG
jgi:hypothetical protein